MLAYYSLKLRDNRLILSSLCNDMAYHLRSFVKD